jgi:hypothetical protein
MCSRYVEFYLDLIGSADTVSLLYHLAMKLKTVRDSESREYSEVCSLDLPSDPRQFPDEFGIAPRIYTQ